MKYLAMLTLMVSALAGFPQVLLGQALSEQEGSDIRLDHRIHLHYSAEMLADIKQKQPAKLKQLNYYFQESYYLKENKACENCPQVDLSTFDVFDWEYKRDYQRENAIQLTKPGHYIILKPSKKLREIYQTL